MDHGRPAKRPRISHAGAYHDAVPFSEDHDYTIVHASEGKLRKVGNDLLSARVERAPLPTTTRWDNVISWSPPDDPDFALDPDGELYDELLAGGVMEDLPTPNPKKTKSLVSKRPHVVWKESYRQTYLDELLRWAGRGDFCTLKECADCVARSVEKPGVPEYRCEDCMVPDLTCASCCVRRHRLHPFHRIQKWTGAQFIKISLKSLGLTIQLNHASMHCDNPIPCHANMLVLHTNGIHSVAIQYCGCSRAIDQHIQLLRRRLYPASQLTVKTCAMFELLRHLHRLALTTKASTYDFYRCLEKSTNNTGIDPPPSRYRALFRMCLQWRHLQMLKWAGVAHDPAGIAGIQPGQLAISCPSCPRPGVNLSEGWDSVPDEMKFLYMMFICMDANFRLKNQLVSNYSQDPGLGIGWAYMVPRKPYESYVLSRANDQDISTCVGFQALAKANTKFSVGLRYTGVNVAVCGRSEMILPLGVGNLQKGERYPNMDYIFGSVLQFIFVYLVLISYDIACQWFINLSKRIEEHWPEHIKPRPNVKFIPAIPKLHEPMHQTTGHQVYSHNFIKGVGLSDGECPERVWAPHNPLANSTKTQGPGSRQDVLDDHFGFWNWLKYISLGTTLLRKYKAAIADRNIQVEAHRGLSNSLDKDLLDKWEQMCVEWDNDEFPKTKKNPYHMKWAGLSEAQAKKELAEEEARHLAAGGTFLHATTASSFIYLGLDLEETQRRLRRQAKSTLVNLTLCQEGGLAEQRNALLARIRAWELLLPIYIPGLLQYQVDNPSASSPHSDNPEDYLLWLPSRLPEPHRQRICIEGLAAIEEKVRNAQLSDSLEAVQKILKMKGRMIYFKNRNIRGQRDGTRSRAVIDRVHERARASAEKYRAARVAKFSLAGPGEWEKTFQILEDGDIRGYQDPNRLRPRVGRRGVLEDDQVEIAQGAVAQEEEEEFVLFNEKRSRRDGTGETRRTILWIWLTGTTSSGSDDDKDEVLRVEWAKSRARAARANEETLLLKEEMRRVLVSLEWKAKWWKEREQARTAMSKDLAEGLHAYTHVQAGLQEALAKHFRELWKSPLQDAVAPESLDAVNRNEDDDNEEDEDEDEEEDAENGAGGYAEDVAEEP